MLQMVTAKAVKRDSVYRTGSAILVDLDSTPTEVPVVKPVIVTATTVITKVEFVLNVMLASSL